MKLLKLTTLLTVLSLFTVGCGGGAGDPDAPIDDPPSVDANDLDTDGETADDGTGV